MIPVVGRVLADPDAVGLWSALTLAGVIAAFVANGSIWAVVGWLVGGVAAFVLVAVKARRGSQNSARRRLPRRQHRDPRLSHHDA